MAPVASGNGSWTLVIHGGAGLLDRDSIALREDGGARAGLRMALEAGGAVLAAGGSAVDAVEAAVKALEDDPHFNAGRGAVFTYEGTNELDAAIMDGRDRRAGAVAGLTTARNPVSVARTIMESSPHVFLAGGGANAFAAESGAEQVDPSYFRVEERWAQLDNMKRRGAH